MEYIDFVKQLAQDAGDLLLKMAHKRHSITVKEDNSFVSEADIAANDLIVSRIKETYPDHAILSEESGTEGNSPFVWIIDPLDGTHNYLKGNPNWSVSIGLVKDGKPIAGAVSIPCLKELFWAAQGEGAYLNGSKISVSDISELSESMMAANNVTDTKEAQDLGRKLISTFWAPTAKQVRSFGSAAISLSYVANGRIDGYVHPGDKPWDHAAGVILVLEAGGEIRTFGKDEYDPFVNGIIATNKKLFTPVREVVSKLS